MPWISCTCCNHFCSVCSPTCSLAFSLPLASYTVFLLAHLFLLESPFLPVLRTPPRSTNCLYLFLGVRFFLSFRLATVRQSLFRTSLIASWAAAELPATIIALRLRFVVPYIRVRVYVHNSRPKAVGCEGNRNDDSRRTRSRGAPGLPDRDNVLRNGQAFPPSFLAVSSSPDFIPVFHICMYVYICIYMYISVIYFYVLCVCVCVCMCNHNIIIIIIYLYRSASTISRLFNQLSTATCQRSFTCYNVSKERKRVERVGRLEQRRHKKDGRDAYVTECWLFGAFLAI